MAEITAGWHAPVMTRSFREAVEGRDLDAAVALLADDVTFRSPAVFKPYVGKPAVETILRTVFTVFEDFHYVRELTDAHGDALVFTARVGDRSLEGCDFLSLDAEGRITEFAVMVRPLSGLTALAEEMGRRLA